MDNSQINPGVEGEFTMENTLSVLVSEWNKYQAPSIDDTPEGRDRASNTLSDLMNRTAAYVAEDIMSKDKRIDVEDAISDGMWFLDEDIMPKGDLPYSSVTGKQSATDTLGTVKFDQLDESTKELIELYREKSR